MTAAVDAVEPEAPHNVRAPSGLGPLLQQGSIALIILIAFLGLYIGLQRDPSPTALPIAIAGWEVSDQAAATWGDAADVTTVASDTAARRAVKHREVIAAIVPSADSTQIRLYTAGANGPSETAAVTAMVMSYAEASQRTVSATDLVPLAASDPRGNAGFFLTFGVTLASFVFGQILFGLNSTVRLRPRVLSMVGFALVSGIVAALLAGPVFGSSPGPLPPLIGTLSLLGLAVSATTLALGMLLGPAGLAVATIILTVAGNAIGGAAIGPHLLPPIAAAAGSFLPPGAAFRTITGIDYFNGAGVFVGLLTLAAWTIVALAVVTAREVRTDKPVASVVP